MRRPAQLELGPAQREAGVMAGHVEEVPLMERGQGGERAGCESCVSNGSDALLSRFVWVVSIGGLLFGLDTGVISGALPYIRDDLLQPYTRDHAALAHWQELIVSAAIVAAGAGSVVGGWLADRLGRKSALVLADMLFTAGALAMAAAPDQYWLIAGRALVGLGVGLASVTVSIFIAECAPPARRAGLVTVNVLMITGGQFVAYVADYVFSFVPGTWRWMLGVAALPSLLQLGGLLRLPESPRWLASKGRAAAAQCALQQLGGGSPVAAGVAVSASPAAGLNHGRASEASEDSGDGSNYAAAGAHVHAHGGGGGGSFLRRGTPWRLLRLRPVLRELHVGVGLQVLQQVCGINTVMYYTPSILQFSGLSNQGALLFSMVPAATNALGTVVGMRCIDRFGRRRLLLSSIAAVVVALAALGSAFLAAERHSPQVLPAGVGGGTAEGACPAAGVAGAVPDCTACLRHGCGFCGGGDGGDDWMAPGSCLGLDPQQQQQQQQPAAACLPPDQLFLHGCPSRYTFLILACLVAYLAAFSPGLGPVPWAINAEIYPMAVRGVATGLAATANWVSNAAVAQTFLTLTHSLGGSGAFYLYAAMACAGFLWAFAALPETSGLTLDQVQELFGGEDGTGDSGGGGGGGSSGGMLWSRHRKKRSSDGKAEVLGGT